MKNLLIICFIALTAVSSFAKNNSNIETLFDSEDLRSGGYGAVELKSTDIAGDWQILVGGRGGWIINSTFSLGLAGYGLVTSPEIDNYEHTDFINGFDTNVVSTAYLRTGYGGLFLEYTNSSNSKIHFTVNALIGAGGVAYTRALNEMSDEGQDGYRAYNDDVFESSAYFIFEPGATVELNVTKFFRIAAGAGYRLVSGLDLTRTTDSDMSGLTANLTFKFGSF